MDQLPLCFMVLLPDTGTGFTGLSARKEEQERGVLWRRGIHRHTHCEAGGATVPGPLLLDVQPRPGLQDVQGGFEVLPTHMPRVLRSDRLSREVARGSVCYNHLTVQKI